jgi:hypothetical protein
VLLVDDDAADSALVIDAFTSRRLSGHLERVADGAQALAHLRREAGEGGNGP